MTQTVVQVRVDEHRSLLAFLREQGQVSMANDVENDFKKVLVVSAASFFEKRIVDALHAFASKAHDSRMAEIMVSTAFKREKYSSMFQWTANNVNSFLALFGREFKASVSEEIGKDPQLMTGMRAFLQLGEHRNRLVHNDFADLTVGDKTVDEVFAAYVEADHFVDHLCTRLRA